MADLVTGKGEAATEPPARSGRIAPRAWTAATWLQRRFGLAYILLAVIVGVAVGGFVVLLGRHSTNATTASARAGWKPAAKNNTTTLAQIAVHVAPAYQRDNGQQLVGIIPKVAEYQDVPITAVVIHTGFRHDTRVDLRVKGVDRAGMYIFCGAGRQCSIPGNPSAQRGILAMREALELALYSFKYIPSLDSLLVFFPPVQPGQNRAVFFQRGDLAAQLRRPLSDTVEPRSKLRPALLSSGESQRLLRTVGPHFYTVSQVSQIADGTVALTLEPMRSPSEPPGD